MASIPAPRFPPALPFQPQHNGTTPQLAKQNRRSAPRSKLGCNTCKRRKVKCDEGVPGCANCGRLDISCSYVSCRTTSSAQTENAHEDAAHSHQNRRGSLDQDKSYPQNAFQTNIWQGVDDLVGEINPLDLEYFSPRTLDLFNLDNVRTPSRGGPLSWGESLDKGQNGWQHQAPESSGEIASMCDVGGYPDIQISRSNQQVLPTSISTIMSQVSGMASQQNSISDAQLGETQRISGQVACDPMSQTLATSDDLKSLADLRIPTLLHQFVPDADMLTRSSPSIPSIYFRDVVFIPSISAADPLRWRRLCQKILGIARKSIIISYAVMALTQQHFVKFALKSSKDGADDLRTGKKLAQHLYTLTSERLDGEIQAISEKQERRSKL